MPNETAKEVLAAAVAALEAGQRVAMLTVVRTVGSTPRRGGAKMLLAEDGRMAGTIGGGTLEERALQEAAQALKEGRSRLTHYELTGAGENSLGLCGGSMDVSIEILEPPLRLLLVGAGHIAVPLAAMAVMTSMDVIIVDDRPEYATRERFPSAKEVHVVAYDRNTRTLGPLPVSITPSTAVVIATWGWDEAALRQVLPTPAYYIGLVASRHKKKLIFDHLVKEGFTVSELERVRAPAGLDVGRDMPGEIAVSILAEILMVRNRLTGRPLMERHW